MSLGSVFLAFSVRSSMMRSHSSMIALVIGCLSLAPIAAQQAKPNLELSTVTGQTTFHIGERITLKLTLTGPDNKQYSINTAGYDRSGRLDIDTFDVNPAVGWSDPLARYFSQGAIGGGLSGSEALSSKPTSFDSDLNEHVRFDQPGTYMVTATSHRIGATGRSGFPTAPFLSVRSNAVEIRIIPATRAWQAEKLHSILKQLAAPVQQPSTGIPSKEGSIAIADLRFLNSPAAIEELVAHLREGFDDTSRQLMWAAALGLSGVPDSLRDTAVTAMDRKLDDPDFPVGQLFLTKMTELEASPQGTLTNLGPTQRPESILVWKQAFSGLARKQGTARASTAEALLSEVPEGEPAEMKAQVAAIVASSFTNLPIDRQLSELQYNWDNLSQQPMLPVLQALSHSLKKNGDSSFYSPADLNAIVLRRWFELDPDGAVRELAVQLASPQAQLNSRSIASLPGGPFPQFEDAWARELVKSENEDRQTLLAALLTRFGTGSATGLVESKLDSLVGKWACEPQAAALAYVVKFKSYNVDSLLRRAMASTQATHCYITLFSSISTYGQGPALNEAAVLALSKPNPRAAADAAQYLTLFGTQAVKQPLLTVYREWNERWAGKPGDVDPATPSGYPVSELGQSLGEALIGNQGWMPDAKLIAEVLSRCVGEQMCTQLQHFASEAAFSPQNVILDGSASEERYQIGQFTSKTFDLFEAKIAQFPSGTKFQLVSSTPQNGDQLKLEREAEALFRKHGFTLRPPSPPVVMNSSLK